jgi:hypothetical protein
VDHRIWVHQSPPPHSATNMDSINFDALAWHMRNPSSTPPTSQHIEIEISRILPHLCSDVTIHHLLDGIYDIQRITFLHSNITYWVLIHTSDLLAIPSIAPLGVKRATQNGNYLNIWPLWYNTRPVDLVNFIYPREHPETPSQCRGNSIEGHTSIMQHRQP